MKVALMLWLDFNVLFVLWRIYRGVEEGEICLAEKPGSDRANGLPGI